MAVKVASAIVTFLISIAAAVFILFMMLLAMNGYTESDAMWGLGAFIVMSLIICVGLALGAYYLSSRLLNRSMSSPIALLTAIPACSALAAVLEIVASFIGVGISEFVRVNY